MTISSNNCRPEQGSSYRSGLQRNSLAAMAIPSLLLSENVNSFSFPAVNRVSRNASPAEQRRFLSEVLSAAIAIADETDPPFDEDEDVPVEEDSQNSH